MIRIESIANEDIEIDSEDFVGLNLNSTDLHRAFLNNKNCNDMSAVNSSFRNAMMYNSTFKNSNFEKSNFWLSEAYNSDFSLACFKCSYAIGANFNNSKLTCTDFSDSVFKNSNFDNTNFNEANFNNADFEGSSFLGANLICDNLEMSNLIGAKYDEHTIFPKEFNPVEHQMIYVKENGEVKERRSIIKKLFNKLR